MGLFNWKLTIDHFYWFPLSTFRRLNIPTSLNTTLLLWSCHKILSIFRLQNRLHSIRAWGFCGYTRAASFQSPDTQPLVVFVSEIC